MSLGLLGAYQSSDTDESDCTDDNDDSIRTSASESDATRQAGPSEALENPFVTNRSSPVLPKPSFMQEQQEKVPGVNFDNSVFSNPFRDKEEKKRAILEQHVHMTQRQEEMRMIDGKKVCWMYRKGRCRQGAKCQFAHDNDVKTDRPREVNKYDCESQISVDKSTKGAVNNICFNQPPESELVQSQIEEEEAIKRKKRPGLSQTLVPSKKAMIFHKQVYGSK